MVLMRKPIPRVRNQPAPAGGEVDAENGRPVLRGSVADNVGLRHRHNGIHHDTHNEQEQKGHPQKPARLKKKMMGPAMIEAMKRTASGADAVGKVSGERPGGDTSDVHHGHESCPSSSSLFEAIDHEERHEGGNGKDEDLGCSPDDDEENEGRGRERYTAIGMRSLGRGGGSAYSSPAHQDEQDDPEGDDDKSRNDEGCPPTHPGGQACGDQGSSEIAEGATELVYAQGPALPLRLDETRDCGGGGRMISPRKRPRRTMQTSITP